MSIIKKVLSRTKELYTPLSIQRGFGGEAIGFAAKAIGLRCEAALILLLLSSCSYDESVETCDVAVQLVYPEGSNAPHTGVRVELKDARASIFVDSTDMRGIAHFVVPPGVYEASSSGQTRVYGERYDTLYIYNGVRSQQVIAPDSTNQIDLDLKVSFKRLFH